RNGAGRTGRDRRRVYQPGHGHDVSAEQQRENPIAHHTQPARRSPYLNKVDAAGGPPAREAAETDTAPLRNAPLAAERGDLAQRPMTVGPQRPAVLTGHEVGAEPPGLPQGVLAGGRIDLAWRGLVGHRGAIAQRPDVVVPLHLQGWAHPNTAALVERKSEPSDDRIGLATRRPHQQPGVEFGSVAQRDPPVDDLDQPGAES